MFVRIYIFVLFTITQINSYDFDLRPNCLLTETDQEALFLTPLIGVKPIEDIQSLSRVNYEEFDGTSGYSGYLTVRGKSSLFFWLIESIHDRKNAPVILWLEGYPGYSSMKSTFYGNGPFVLEGREIRKQPYSWNIFYNVIYIDSPVGTGFSIAHCKYAKNETQVAKDLYEALKQIFTIFPHLQKNDFYVAGSSYAGKHVPGISHLIHTQNQIDSFKINLKGLSIGNGFSDPLSQLKYGDFLYHFGYIDINGLELAKYYEAELAHSIYNENWEAVYKNGSRLYGLNPGLLKEITGYSSTENILQCNYDSKDKDLRHLFRSAEIRKALHVGNAMFNHGNSKVMENLSLDFGKSVKNWISELLANYKVVIYHGMLDMMISYRSTEDYLMDLQHPARNEFRLAEKRIWKVNGRLAGYSKTAGNLTLVLVRNAGHNAIQDQPFWCKDIVNRMIFGKAFQ